MSKPAKYKETVLKDYPIEKALLSFRNNEYINWEMRCQDGKILLRSNRSLIREEALVSQLKCNYFAIDELEVQQNANVARSRPPGSIEAFQRLQSVTNFAELTRKNMYLLAFPVAKMMLRPQEHLRVFTDSVLEYIPILLQQQGTPIENNDQRLKKYEKSWKTSENHLYNTIEIDELNKVLEDFDIDKSAITLVLDPVYSWTSVQMLEKGSDPIYTISPDGEAALGVFQAAHYIFQSLVCGINWTSKGRKNQLDGLKKQILGVMNKYCNLQETLCISKTSIDEDIQVVNSNPVFFQHKKPFKLWSDLNPADNISVKSVIAFLKSFGHSPSTNPECSLFILDLGGLSHMGVWLARWNTMDAWAEVFFNKDTEKLKQMVRDSLGVRISGSSREALCGFIAPITSKLPSSSATSSITSAQKYRGSMWNVMDLPACQIRIIQNDQSKWQLRTSEGPILSSNQFFLAQNINNAWEMHYFVLDIEDQMNMESFLFSEYYLPNIERTLLEIECYSSLTKFAKYCTKNIYIRSFSPAKIEQELDRRVFTDDVLEAIPILLEQQNTPLNSSDDRLQKLQEKWKPDASHLYSTIKDTELFQILEEFDINKEKVIRVADSVYLQTADLTRENGCSPIITYSNSTEVVMDISQALLYTFQSLICGFNWETAKSTDYKDFKKKVLVVLREYTNLKEGTLITREYVEENIGKLKTHSAYMERVTHQWPDYLMVHKKAKDRTTLSTVSKIMTSLGLQVGPPGDVACYVWQCRYYTMRNTAKVFFEDKVTKMYRLLTGAMIRTIPESDQNFFLYAHIQSEKDEIEEEPEKEAGDENVVINETITEEKVEPKNTEIPSQSRLNDFEQNLRNAMRKKKDLQKTKKEKPSSETSSKQSPERVSEETVQPEGVKSPVQEQSDKETEEASSQKLNEEIAKMKEELHQIQVTFDLTRSDNESELSKKTQEVDDLKKQLEEKNKEISSLQSSNTNPPNNSVRLQQELTDMSMINAELRDTNLRLSARNEEQARVIENLLDRLTRPRTN